MRTMKPFQIGILHLMSTKNKTIALFPEGPIAFDGSKHFYSKGERLYIDRLAQHFKEVLVVSLYFRPGDPYYETCTHSVFESPNIRFVEIRPAGSGGVLSKINQIRKSFITSAKALKQADVAYLFLPSYHSAAACLAARMLKKKIIVYGADDWVKASESMFKWPRLRKTPFFYAYKLLNLIMEASIIRSATFAVVAGGQLRQKYRSFGTSTYLTSPRMTLCREDIRERENTCNDKIIKVITVGALIHDKAQHYLLKAFHQVLNTIPTSELLIIGSGPEYERLVTLSHQLGINDKVHFLGFVEEEETLYDLLFSADIFVLTSITEGFPRVLYEAMATRLPIVTTDVGGIPFLLKNELNALVVPEGQPEKIAEAIIRMVDNTTMRFEIIREAAKTLDKIFSEMDASQIANLIYKHSVFEL